MVINFGRQGVFGFLSPVEADVLEQEDLAGEEKRLGNFLKEFDTQYEEVHGTVML
jgi:hypothetical protein